MDYTKGCTDMLKFWLGTYEEAATWDRLIKALKAKGLQLNAIALDIKREVVKGQCNVMRIKIICVHVRMYVT